MDPDNWKVAYAVDDRTIYKIDDASDGTKKWVDIGQKLPYKFGLWRLSN